MAAAAIIARRSKKFARNEASLDDQVARGYEMAEADGVPVDPAYVIEEDGKSGALTASARGLGRIIEEVEAGRITHVYAWHTDRLSREDTWDAVENVSRIRKAGGRVRTWENRFDSDDERACEDLAREARYARQHWETAKARSIPPVVEGVRLGAFVGGKAGEAPYGYVRGEAVKTPGGADVGKGKLRRLAPDMAEEANGMAKFDVRGRIIEMRAQGASYGAIIEWLHAEAIPSPGGAQWWQKSTLCNLIRQRVSLGEVSYRVMDKDGVLLADVVTTDAHPTCVDEAVWRAAQAAQTTSRRVEGKDTLTTLLGGMGLVRCDCCGGAMTVHRAGKGARRPFYNCQRRGCPEKGLAYADELDGLVVDFLREAFGLNGGGPVVQAVATSQRRSEALARVDTLRARLDDLLADQDNWDNLADWREAVNGARARLDMAEVDLRDAEAATTRIAGVSEIDLLGDDWDKLSVGHRRHALAALLGAVRVRSGQRRGDLADRVRVVWPDGTLAHGEVQTGVNGASDVEREAVSGLAH